MKALFIIDDEPSGHERPYKAFRLVMNLAGHKGTHVRVFVIGEAVKLAAAHLKVIVF